MEQFLLVHVPGVVLALLFVAVAIGASLVGLFLVRRSVALATLEQHNDVAGFIIAVVGVLYAVLLGFVTVTVWQQYDSASSSVHSEAISVEALYRDASAFPDGQSQPLQRDLVRYAESVAHDEWETMHTDQQGNKKTDALLGVLWSDLRAVHTNTPDQNAFYSEAITQMNRLEETRSSRLDDAARTLPGVLWVVLLIGAVITVGFTYFFGLSNRAAHALMIAALSSMIGLSFFLILTLDLPFSGSLRVPPKAFQQTLQELRSGRLNPGAG